MFCGILVGEQKDGIFAPTNPKWPVRLGVRTADFHSVNRGSIPLRATTVTHQHTDLKSVRCVFLLVVVGLVVGLCRIAPVCMPKNHKSECT